MMKKMILKGEEKHCLKLIAECKAKIQAGTAGLLTKMFLKSYQETLAEIQKELSMLEK